VNVDFADVRTVMTNAGTSLMGQGRASGKGRAREAALQVTFHHAGCWTPAPACLPDSQKEACFRGGND